jgi:hypothetical protein
LPPAFLQAKRNFLRALPCRPLALAWSLQDFDIADFSLGLAAAGADGDAGAGAGVCAKAAVAFPTKSASATQRAILMVQFLISAWLRDCYA